LRVKSWWMDGAHGDNGIDGIDGTDGFELVLFRFAGGWPSELNWSSRTQSRSRSQSLADNDN
jgi:hypothetical protein